MHDRFAKGLSYSAVNFARSELANYFMGENLSNSEFSVASHRLLNATGMVMYPLDKLTLKELSFKLVVLLTILRGNAAKR